MAERAVDTRPGCRSPGRAERRPCRPEDAPAGEARRHSRQRRGKATRPRSSSRSAPTRPRIPPPWRTARATAAASMRANCLIADSKRKSKIKPMTKFIAKMLSPPAFAPGDGWAVPVTRRRYADFTIRASATAGAAPPGRPPPPAQAPRGRRLHRPRPRAGALPGARLRPSRRRYRRRRSGGRSPQKCGAPRGPALPGT